MIDVGGAVCRDQTLCITSAHCTVQPGPVCWVERQTKEMSVSWLGCGSEADV